MKKRLSLIILWIGVSILLIGCRGNDVGADSTQVESTGMETESEIVKETESETDRAEDTDKLFAGYTVKDIDLSFLVEDMEGYTAWANKVTLIEDKIYFTVLLYSEVEENPSLFRLVSCKPDGSDMQAVPLEVPEIEKKGYELYTMTVGKDGCVYAIKSENENGYKPHYAIGIPGFTEAYSLISWDAKGQIVFESQIQSLEKKYQNVAIENIYVSKDGTITMSGTCQDFMAGLIMQVKRDGSAGEIVSIEPLVSFMKDCRWYNDDGTVCTRKEVGDQLYYVIYNANNQTLEEIEVPMEYQEYEVPGVHVAPNGTRYDIVYLRKDDLLYRYDMISKELETRINVEDLNSLFEIIEVNEDTFIMHYGDGQSYKIGIFTKDSK